MSGEVDLFVRSLGPDWQRAACTRLLEDIRVSAHFGEHIKWGHPYFELSGAAVLKWFCAEEWINVYFFRGRELPDPHGLFEDSDNRKMLTVRLTAADQPHRDAFRDLVSAAAARAAEGARTG